MKKKRIIDFISLTQEERSKIVNSILYDISYWEKRFSLLNELLLCYKEEIGKFAIEVVKEQNTEHNKKSFEDGKVFFEDLISNYPAVFCMYLGRFEFKDVYENMKGKLGFLHVSIYRNIVRNSKEVSKKIVSHLLQKLSRKCLEFHFEIISENEANPIEKMFETLSSIDDEKEAKEFLLTIVLNSEFDNKKLYVNDLSLMAFYLLSEN